MGWRNKRRSVATLSVYGGHDGYPCSFSASFLSYRPSIFENTYLGYSALKGTCKHFRNGLYSRAIWTRLLSSSLPFPRFFFFGKKKIFKFEILPVNRRMRCVPLKWWLERGRVSSWKELEMRFILKNFYLMLFRYKWNSCSSFRTRGMEIERRWEFILISTTFWRSNFFFGREGEGFYERQSIVGKIILL